MSIWSRNHSDLARLVRNLQDTNDRTRQRLTHKTHRARSLSPRTDSSTETVLSEKTWSPSVKKRVGHSVSFDGRLLEANDPVVNCASNEVYQCVPSPVSTPLISVDGSESCCSDVFQDSGASDFSDVFHGLASVSVPVSCQNNDELSPACRTLPLLSFHSSHKSQSVDGTQNIVLNGTKAGRSQPANVLVENSAQRSKPETDNIQDRKTDIQVEAEPVDRTSSRSEKVKGTQNELLNQGSDYVDHRVMDTSTDPSSSRLSARSPDLLRKLREVTFSIRGSSRAERRVKGRDKGRLLSGEDEMSPRPSTDRKASSVAEDGKRSLLQKEDVHSTPNDIPLRPDDSKSVLPDQGIVLAPPPRKPQGQLSSEQKGYLRSGENGSLSWEQERTPVLGEKETFSSRESGSLSAQDRSSRSSETEGAPTPSETKGPWTPKRNPLSSKEDEIPLSPVSPGSGAEVNSTSREDGAVVPVFNGGSSYGNVRDAFELEPVAEEPQHGKWEDVTSTFHCPVSSVAQSVDADSQPCNTANGNVSFVSSSASVSFTVSHPHITNSLSTSNDIFTLSSADQGQLMVHDMDLRLVPLTSIGIMVGANGSAGKSSDSRSVDIKQKSQESNINHTSTEAHVRQTSPEADNAHTSHETYTKQTPSAVDVKETSLDIDMTQKSGVDFKPTLHEADIKQAASAVDVVQTSPNIDITQSPSAVDIKPILQETYFKQTPFMVEMRQTSPDTGMAQTSSAIDTKQREIVTDVEQTSPAVDIKQISSEVNGEQTSLPVDIKHISREINAKQASSAHDIKHISSEVSTEKTSSATDIEQISGEVNAKQVSGIVDIKRTSPELDKQQITNITQTSPEIDVKQIPPVVNSAKHIPATNKQTSPLEDAKDISPEVETLPVEDVKYTLPGVETLPVEDVKYTPPGVETVPVEDVKHISPGVETVPAEGVKNTSFRVDTLPREDVKNTPFRVHTLPREDVKNTSFGVDTLPREDVKHTPQDVNHTSPEIKTLPKENAINISAEVEKLPREDVKHVSSDVEKLPEGHNKQMLLEVDNGILQRSVCIVSSVDMPFPAAVPLTTVDTATAPAPFYTHSSEYPPTHHIRPTQDSDKWYRLDMNTDASDLCNTTMLHNVRDSGAHHYNKTSSVQIQQNRTTTTMQKDDTVTVQLDGRIQTASTIEVQTGVTVETLSDDTIKTRTDDRAKTETAHATTVQRDDSYSDVANLSIDSVFIASPPCIKPACHDSPESQSSEKDHAEETGIGTENRPSGSSWSSIEADSVDCSASPSSREGDTGEPIRGTASKSTDSPSSGIEADCVDSVGPQRLQTEPAVSEKREDESAESSAASCEDVQKNGTGNASADTSRTGDRCLVLSSVQCSHCAQSHQNNRPVSGERPRLNNSSSSVGASTDCESTTASSRKSHRRKVPNTFSKSSLSMGEVVRNSVSQCLQRDQSMLASESETETSLVSASVQVSLSGASESKDRRSRSHRRRKQSREEKSSKQDGDLRSQSQTSYSSSVDSLLSVSDNGSGSGYCSDVLNYLTSSSHSQSQSQVQQPVSRRRLRKLLKLLNHPDQSVGSGVSGLSDFTKTVADLQHLCLFLSRNLEQQTQQQLLHQQQQQLREQQQLLQEKTLQEEQRLQEQQRRLEEKQQLEEDQRRREEGQLKHQQLDLQQQAGKGEQQQQHQQADGQPLDKEHEECQQGHRPQEPSHPTPSSHSRPQIQTSHPTPSSHSRPQIQTSHPTPSALSHHQPETPLPEPVGIRKGGIFPRSRRKIPKPDLSSPPKPSHLHCLTLSAAATWNSEILIEEACKNTELLERLGVDRDVFRAGDSSHSPDDPEEPHSTADQAVSGGEDPKEDKKQTADSGTDPAKMEAPEETVVKLDDEFDKMLVDMKPHVLKLPSKSDRLRCAVWIKKLCEPPSSVITGRKNRNMYSQLMLHMLKRDSLQAPFDKKPEDGPLQPLPSYMSIYFDEPLERPDGDVEKLPDWVEGELGESVGSSLFQRSEGLGNPAATSTWMSSTGPSLRGLRQRPHTSMGITLDKDPGLSPIRGDHRQHTGYSADDLSMDIKHSPPRTRSPTDRERRQLPDVRARRVSPEPKVREQSDLEWTRPTGITASSAASFATRGALYQDDTSIAKPGDKEVALHTRITAKYHEEKLRLQQKHDAAVQKILDRKNSEIEDVKSHYRSKTKDLEETITKLERKVQTLVKESGIMRETKDKQIAELKKMVEESSETQRNEYEKRIHDLEADFEQQKFELQKLHTRNIQEILDDTNARLQRMDAEYNQQAASTTNVIKDLEGRVQQLTGEVDRTLSQRSVLEKEKAELQVRVDKLTSDLEEQHHRNKHQEREYQKKLESSEHEMRTLRNKTEASLEFLKQEHSLSAAKASDTVSDLEQQVQQLTKAVKIAEEERQRQMREMEQVHQQDKLHLENLHDKQVRSMKKELEQLEQDMQRKMYQQEQLLQHKDGEIQKQKELSREQATQAEKALDEFKQQVEKNQAQIYSEMKQQMDQVEADLKKSKQVREKQSREFSRQLDEEKYKHEHELTEMKMNFDNEKAQLLHEVHMQKEYTTTEHERELEQVRESHRNEMKTLESHCKERQEKDAKATGELEAQLAELREELVQANQLRKQQLVELGLLREKEKQKIQRDHEAEMSRHRTDSEQQRLELQKMHSAETERLLEKTNDRLKSIEREYMERGKKSSETITELQNTIKQLREDIKMTKSTAESRVLEVRSQAEEEKLSLKKQYSTNLSMLQQELESQRSRSHNLDRQIQQQEADHEEKVTRLKLEHEDKMRGLLPGEMKQELEDTISSLKSQVNTLQQRAAMLQEELDLRLKSPLGTFGSRTSSPIKSSV